MQLVERLWDFLDKASAVRTRFCQMLHSHLTEPDHHVVERLVAHAVTVPLEAACVTARQRTSDEPG